VRFSGSEGNRSLTPRPVGSVLRFADDYVFLSEFSADLDKRRLATPSGRIELYSERIARFGYDDCPPHATWLEPNNGSAALQPRPIRSISYRASPANDCTARWTRDR
jgi:hypothetical protein